MLISRTQRQTFQVLFAFGIFAMFTSSSVAYAQEGCCSWHVGIEYCGVFDYYICEDGQQSPTCRCDFVGEAEEKLDQLYQGYIDSIGAGEYSCQLGAIYVQKMQVGKQQYSNLAELTGYEMSNAARKIEKDKKDEIQQMNTQAAIRGAGWSGAAMKAIRDRENEWDEYINQVERMYQNAIDRIRRVISSYEITHDSLVENSNQCLEQEYEVKEKQSMTSKCGPNSRMNNAEECICQSGYEMNTDHQCVTISDAPDSASICDVGYMLNKRNACVLKSKKPSINSLTSVYAPLQTTNDEQKYTNNASIKSLGMQDRTCSRVQMRFGSNAKTLENIN